ncbi:unnamed protein product, partial [Durusdinium trenchii]
MAHSSTESQAVTKNRRALEDRILAWNEWGRACWELQKRFLDKPESEVDWRFVAFSSEDDSA